MICNAVHGSIDRANGLITLGNQEYGFIAFKSGDVLVVTRVDADGHQELNRRLSLDAARALWTLLARQALDGSIDDAYEQHLDRIAPEF